MLFYCRHRATNRAVVRLDGKDFYLGPYGSSESRAEYDRLIAEWLANGRRRPGPADEPGPPSLTINNLILAYIGMSPATT